MIKERMVVQWEVASSAEHIFLQYLHYCSHCIHGAVDVERLNENQKQMTAAARCSMVWCGQTTLFFRW